MENISYIECKKNKNKHTLKICLHYICYNVYYAFLFLHCIIYKLRSIQFIRIVLPTQVITASYIQNRSSIKLKRICVAIFLLLSKTISLISMGIWSRNRSGHSNTHNWNKFCIIFKCNFTLTMLKYTICLK